MLTFFIYFTELKNRELRTWKLLSSKNMLDILLKGSKCTTSERRQDTDIIEDFDR